MGLTWKVQEHSTHPCRVVERRGEEKELCSSRVQHKTLIFTFWNAYKVDWGANSSVKLIWQIPSNKESVLRFCHLRQSDLSDVTKSWQHFFFNWWNLSNRFDQRIGALMLTTWYGQYFLKSKLLSLKMLKGAKKSCMIILFCRSNTLSFN